MEKNGVVEVVEEKALGRVQLRSESGEIILVPKPSTDPNDPLNWSQPFKIYVAVVTCFGMLMCTFLAAGPTVALVQIAMDFSGGNPNLEAIIPQVAFFFTTSALTQGTGNLLWQPLINKYGRRPMYIISFSGYFATAIWCGTTSNFTSELVGRIFLGFFSGAGECLGPATISDIFFLHERGTMMAMYNFATGSGVSIGIIISGFIVVNNSWRVIYTVGAVMIGALLLLIIFTFPETAYNRSYEDSQEGDIFDNKQNPYRLSLSIILNDAEKARVQRYYDEHDRLAEMNGPEESTQITVIQRMEERIRRLEAAVLGSPQYSPISQAKKPSYWSKLALFTGETYTNDSLWKMFVRPFGLVILPPVMWATLVMSATIGFSVALSSTFANDFARVYNFTAFQAGLGFFGSLLGGILAIPAGGPVGEAIANYFTIRNKGIREPEFRLPAMAISMVTAPVALILYGAGLQFKLPFMVPIIGIGLLTFSIGQGINISFVYTLDAYGPVRGEVTIAQLAFKSIIGFGLSATTNSWIAGSGELVALSEMAGITFFVLSLWVPMFFWGARLRRWSLGWKAVSFVKWKEL
ncbi:MFS general substrate transporter [Mollisia scopiformis]|uniref:MFS general substrate transporter n=1 Tax=Mollisia scopiformis TaxID=149040 RepID=A0A132B377_MOLSC|nr:MFS general substrate transporter [Mollisia scopiformis]KUJ06858.1 MFS general substrate transporter [Mollisia scopiformis]